MAKGYQANKDHRDEISLFGKAIGKNAGFKCEWCGARLGAVPGRLGKRSDRGKFFDDVPKTELLK
jgi:hypothetical protein